MQRSLARLAVLMLGGAFVTAVPAQHPLNSSAPPGAREGPCGVCHLCEKPSAQNPCLRSCPRDSPEAIAKQLAGGRPPDVVILDELEDLYLPVPFDHKGHAEMAEMTMGCAVCHHYTPEEAAHPACKSCHEVSPMREDMLKPGLKGAYHRQCLSCHREWSHATACEVCHPPKAGQRHRIGLKLKPSKDDIVGRMHPPIPEPEVEVYQTKYQYRAGTKVVFRHKEHTHRFGFRCAECHREDNCSRCHEEGKKHTQRVKTLEEHHNPCAACHDMVSPDRCSHCHLENGAPVPDPFDHAATGWPLSRYHKDKSCRACHKTVPFAKLDRKCSVCHAGWAPDNFDHDVTGQCLDETHKEIDCDECHSKGGFSGRPTCDECHDKDDGVTFPARRPGELVDAKTAPGK